MPGAVRVPLVPLWVCLRMGNLPNGGACFGFPFRQPQKGYFRQRHTTSFEPVISDVPGFDVLIFTSGQLATGSGNYHSSCASLVFFPNDCLEYLGLGGPTLKLPG